MTQPIISVVVPVHNEQANLRELHRRLVQTAQRMADQAAFEFVFVDDGSTDGSLAVLRELAVADERIIVVQLTRNWGSHAALKAGMRACKGTCCAAISADLQDPPEVLQDLFHAHQQGFDVVWGTRASRQDPFFKTLWAKAFYGIFRLALPNLPSQGVDVFLVSRQVCDDVLSFRERNTAVYYLILWLGYPYAVVPYHRAARSAGVSKWTFRRRLRMAFDTLTTFTAAPLHWLSFLGAALLAIGLFWGLGCLLTSRVANNVAGAGLAFHCFFSGLNLLALGILGEYLWRLTVDVRQRPEYGIKHIFRGGNEVPRRQDNEGRAA